MRTKASRTRSRSTRPVDYVAVAIAYAEDAVQDRRKYGRWVRLAAKRFLADLKHAQTKRPRFLWSPGQANRACEFIELLPHVEGQWDSPTIRLEPAQVFFLCALFGFRNADGSRRFTTALFAVGRKNGKSALAAAILLYVFCTEPELGPQVLSAATTGSQARIVWGVAKRMVEKTPALREAFSLEPFANAIARYEVGGTFRPINAKASSQDGLNPSALCFDELHAHKTRDLFDVLRSAAGARKSPLFLYTTTEGYENPGPWSEVRTFMRQVLEGVVEADHFLAVYYALDEDDDDFDESKWIKANPLLGISVSLSELRKHAIEAKQQPGSLAEFQIKRLNRQAAAAEGFIDLRRWRRCSGELPVEKLRGAPCWAAIDLAATTDMNAWAMLWKIGAIYYARVRFWVPESAVKSRTERRTASYAGWVEAGHIRMTEGDVVDYAVIEAEVLADCEVYGPKLVAYDPWNATQFAQRLTDAGLELRQFIQGLKSYTPAMKELERAYTSGALRHGGNPVLTWNAANLVARRDGNLNMAPDKKRSADKIDGIVALIMAFGLAVDVDDAGDPSGFFAKPVRG